MNNMRVYPNVSGLSHSEATQSVMMAKVTRLTQNSDTLAESCTICSSCSRWPVRKFLGTHSCRKVI